MDMRKLYFYFCSLFCTYLSKTSSFFSINIRIQKYVFLMYLFYMFTCFFLLIHETNGKSMEWPKPCPHVHGYFKKRSFSWAVPLVRLFVKLYHQKQQQTNGGGNQNSASFKRFTCVRINVHFFSQYTEEEMDGATKEITIIKFNFQK